MADEAGAAVMAGGAVNEGAVEEEAQRPDDGPPPEQGAENEGEEEEEAAPLSDEDQACIALLDSLGQQHITQNWPRDLVHRNMLVEQVGVLDGSYPGGLRAYLSNAQTVLQQFAKNKTPYEGLKPLVPACHKLDVDTAEFHEAESTGVHHIADACVVLVAGSTAASLGFEGPSVCVPVDVCSLLSYLKLCCQYLLSWQRAATQQRQHEVVIPLCVIVSASSHGVVQELMTVHANFGLAQVHVISQPEVPLLRSQTCQLATHWEQRKAHILPTAPQRGSAHTLLLNSGLLGEWEQAGKKWLCFLDETNPLCFRGVLGTLGTSVTKELVVNYLAVTRPPGERTDSLVRVKSGGKSVIVGVNHKFFASFLRAGGMTYGDVAGDDGFSTFPADTHAVVVQLQGYHAGVKAAADAGGGERVPMTEYAHVQYRDTAKDVFKTPVALQTFVDDVGHLLPENSAMGVTLMERWLVFSPMLCASAEGKEAQEDGKAPLTPGSSEADQHLCTRRLLGLCGVDVREQTDVAVFDGVQVPSGARVVLYPSVACTLAELRSRFPTPDQVHIGDDSTLLVEGAVTIESLSVTGTLILRAVPGASVVVRNLKVVNQGWRLAASRGQDHVMQAHTMRGFTLSTAHFDDDLGGTHYRRYQSHLHHVMTPHSRELAYVVPGEFVLDDPLHRAKDAYHAMMRTVATEIKSAEDSLNSILGVPQSQYVRDLFPNHRNKWPHAKLPDHAWPPPDPNGVAGMVLPRSHKRASVDELRVFAGANPLFVPLEYNVASLASLVPASDAQVDAILKTQMSVANGPHAVVGERSAMRGTAPHADKPTHQLCSIVFVCASNSGLSVMAEAICRKWGLGRVHMQSCGLEAANGVHPGVAEVLRLHHVSVDGLRSKGMDDVAWEGVNVVVGIGADVPGERRRGNFVEWSVADPLASVREEGGDVDLRKEWEAAFVALEPLVHGLVETHSVN